MIRTIMFAVLICGLCSYSYGSSVNIVDFIDKASIRYQKQITVNATLDLWNRILSNPLLVGKLWDIYQFSPHYKVTKKGSGVHIFDPTGIEGDLVEIHSDKYKRIFIANGKIKNWYIPVSLKGRVLFLIHQAYDRNRVSVTINIYAEEGDTLMTKLLLKALSPVLRYYINKRVTRNMNDLTTIVDDIVSRPDSIRSKMNSRFLNEFNQLLITESEKK